MELSFVSHLGGPESFDQQPYPDADNMAANATRGVKRMPEGFQPEPCSGID